MNCTAQEFKDRIVANLPAKYIVKHFLPIVTIYALDTWIETQLDIKTQESLSSHTWEAGAVIKDTTGLFIPIFTRSTTQAYAVPVGGNYNMLNNISHASPIGFTLNRNAAHNHSVDYGFNPQPKTTEPPKPLKCGCGAHSVNSNKHGDYCDLYIKEGA